MRLAVWLKEVRENMKKKENFVMMAKKLVVCSQQQL